MTEEINYTTAPCDWTDKDDDYIVDYVALNELGLPNSPILNNTNGE